MTAIEAITLDVPDTTAAGAFYAAAFDLGDQVRVRAAQRPSPEFRGFTLSLVVSQPRAVDSFIGTALDSGATVIKPAKKSFWGYGGVVRAPDGAIWKIATSSKKDNGRPTREIDGFVVLLGVADVKASKQFYVDHGLDVAKSFGGKYAEFAAPGSSVTLALYGLRALAKDAGVSPDGHPDGAAAHGLTIRADAGDFTDPDGFTWEHGRAES